MPRSPGSHAESGFDTGRSDIRRGRLWMLPNPNDALGAAAPRHYPTRIAVRSSDRVVFVRTDDIDWFEAARNYVKLHIGTQELRIRLRLRELAAELDPSRFRQIHRSTIVNIDRVSEVQPWAGGDYVALLRDRQQLRVSRTYARALLRTLQ
jgi:two-component system, LytTR family, response regulator